MMSSLCCRALIKSWVAVTGDKLTEYVLKFLIYCDKGCDRMIDSSLPAACPHF